MKNRISRMSGVLSVLLTHQKPALVGESIRWWEKWVSERDVLIAYGGKQAHFQDVAHPHKVFVENPRLRTIDHQRELQSYTEIYQKAGERLQTTDHRWVWFSEYDHWPTRLDSMELYQGRMQEENADVLANWLQRVDGTNYPHYLAHANDPQFHAYWRSLSGRENKDVVLSMIGTGSFWTREAFLEIAKYEEPFPMYHELYIPTLAHHLGFRLRNLTDQNQWILPHALSKKAMIEARKHRAWSIHPLKEPPLHLW